MTVAGTDPDRPNKVNQDGSFFLPPPWDIPVVDQQQQQQQQQEQQQQRHRDCYSVTIFGVMDGHGKKGHEVVHYLKQQLPIRLHEYLQRTLRQHPNDNDDYNGIRSRGNSMTTTVVNGIKHTHNTNYNNNETFSLDEQKFELISMGHADPLELFSCNSLEGNVRVSQRIQAAMVDAFVHVQYDIRQNPIIPSSRSGTTCIACVLVEDKQQQQQQQTVLYIATVGDSRCILVSSFTNRTNSDINNNNNNTWMVQSLTNATTVHTPTERRRIDSCGDQSRIDINGNVFYGPIGIAMTRSLGNSVMLRAGILPIPIITKHEIQMTPTTNHGGTDDESKANSITYYICAGTDGIFDVLSNEQVAGILKEGVDGGISSLTDISTNICRAAQLAWLADLPIETKVDDCTMAILKLSR